VPELSIRPLGLHPQPQGSLAYKGHRGGKPILVSDNDDQLKPWRQAVALYTRRACRAHALDWQPLDEPVRLSVTFYVKSPLRPRWPVPATKPDLDKLMRAVMDGLADGGLYVNDSRVFEVGHLRGRYATADRPAGALVLAEWGPSVLPA
jgi:crossover junction endodeoxyribonuclease RusA